MCLTKKLVLSFLLSTGLIASNFCFAATFTNVVVTGSSPNYSINVTGSCTVGQGQTKLFISPNSSLMPKTLLGAGNGTCSGTNAGTIQTKTVKSSVAPGSYYLFIKQGGTITPYVNNPVTFP